MKSISTRLMLAFSLAILLICGGLGAVAYHYASQGIIAVIEEELSGRADDAAQLVAQQIQSSLQLMTVIADSNAVRSMDWEQQSPALCEQSRKLGYKYMGVADSTGHLRTQPAEELNIADREYFQKAMQGERFFTEPVASRIDQSLVCILAVPIYDYDRRVIGVLVAACDAAILSKITNNLHIGQSGYAYILNHRGDTIAHPEFKRVVEVQNHILAARRDEGFKELASLEQRMIQHQTGTGSYDFEQGRKIMGFAPVPGTDWSLAVTAVEDEVLAELNTMKKGIIGASLLAIILGLLLAYYLGRQFRLPLLRAASRCQEMAAGNFSTVDWEGYSQANDEIGALFQGFDKINQDVSKLIEELRNSKERFQYLAEHDVLTGLHNRYYVETQVRQLTREGIVPIGVIVCDLDGLKMVNDSFGQKTGDELLLAFAEILEKHRQSDQIAARSSGDEFVMLLPGLDVDETEELCRQIQQGIDEYNAAEPEVPLSVSMGTAVHTDNQRPISYTIIEAVQHMHHRKLFQHKSMRSTLVDVVMKTLEARDYFTEGHADRLQGLVSMMADDLGLRDHEKDVLRLLARFHDIGKVGIPDHILLKPGRLTEEEFEQMKKHSEIGYRIAQTSPDLAPIADWILMHHEWWDGSGYPLGIKGEEIPIECRILAIADAFDAMISDRPYRKALSFQEALEELRRGAGTQFDPYLVERFVFRVRHGDGPAVSLEIE